MLNKYEKKEAPSWQRKLVVVLGSLCAATFLLFVFWAITLFVEWSRADNCLDQGGSYDYERAECDLDVDHAIPEI